MKRPLTDKVDVFFLLKQTMLITREELANMLPTQQYDDYESTYHRRKINEMFDKNFEKEWFVSRYLDDSFHNQRKKAILEFYEFKHPRSCIVAKNIPADVSGKTICATAEKCPKMERFWIQQGISQSGFSRACYIILSEDFSESSIEFMKFIISADIGVVFEEFDVSLLKEPATPLDVSDCQTAKSIFKSLCRMFSVDEARVTKKYLCRVSKDCTLDGVEDVGLVCGLLKDVFLYCYTCACQYDDPMEMMIRCRNHKETEAARRRRELLCNYREFCHLKTRKMEDELSKMANKVEEGHYRCEFCKKGFEGKDFVFKHFSNKHSDEIQRIERSVISFEKFIDRIDCFALSAIEGTEDDQIPSFAFLNKEDDRAVYNMGAVFSGEIVIERSK